MSGAALQSISRDQARESRMTVDDFVVTDRLGRFFDLGAGTAPFQVAQDGRRPVLSRLEAEHLVGVLQGHGIAATIEPAYPAGLRGVPREELPMPPAGALEAFEPVPAEAVPVVVSPVVAPPEQSPPAGHGAPIAVQPFDTSELRRQIAALLAETEAASAIETAIEPEAVPAAVAAPTADAVKGVQGVSPAADEAIEPPCVHAEPLCVHAEPLCVHAEPLCVHSDEAIEAARREGWQAALDAVLAELRPLAEGIDRAQAERRQRHAARMRAARAAAKGGQR